MNCAIAIESRADALGNKCASAITAQNSLILQGGGNYSLTLADNLYVHNAACAAFQVVAPLCFYQQPRLTTKR